MLPSVRSHFVRTILVVLVLLGVTVGAHAQACDPPIPAPQISAPPQVCPYTPANASVLPPAEGSWQTVSWNIIGGSFVDANNNPITYPSGENVRFSANSSDPVTLFAYATHSAGCSAPEGVTQVQIRTIAAPQISAPPQVCPYTTSTASILPPAEGTWQIVSWSILGGGFVDANGNPVQYPSGETVRFYANTSEPVRLLVTAQDSFGCMSPQGTTLVPIRTIPEPQISAPPQVCPYTPATASILPPAEGTWQIVSWSIYGGGFVDANGNPIQYPNGETVRFYANTSEPVRLFVTAQDSFGCMTTQGTTLVPIRTIPEPQISAPPQVCPYTPATASILPPAEGTWQIVSWSIMGGSFVDANGNPVQYPSGETVRFYANSSSEPVRLSVSAQDSFGCMATQGTTQVPIRTIPAPQISAPPQVCTYTPATASIQPPAEGTWQIVTWSILGGSFVDANGNPIQYPNGETVRFYANSSDPVTLFVSAQDSFGCMGSQGTITIPTQPGAGGPPPSIVLSSPDVCGTETHTASVENVFTSYSWSVINAAITSGDGTNAITFVANGNGPVTVSVTTNGASCPATDSETLPLRGTPVQIWAPSSSCPGSLQKATVPYWYSGFDWTATNATIEGPTDGEVIFFRSTGTGPVTLSVRLLDSNGCFAGNSVTIPVGEYPTPEIALYNGDTICPNGGQSAQAFPDVYPSYNWTVTNATIVSGAGTSAIWYEHTPGTGDVVVTLNVGEGACTATTSRTLAVRSMVVPVFELASATICANGTSTFYIDNYDSFHQVSVYITNGTITNISAGRVPGGRTYTFRNNGAGNTAIEFYTESNNCWSHEIVTATMLAVPTATITAGGPTTFCEGGSVVLTASAGASYAWSNGATTQSISASTAGNYTVTVTNANGCAKTSAATAVTVNPVPSAVITAPSTVCEGTTQAASVNDAGAGATYAWTATNASIVGGQGTTTITFAPSGSGAVELSATVTKGACSATATKTVAVNDAPEFTLFVRAGQSYDLRSPSMSSNAIETNATHEFCGADGVLLTSTVLDPTWTYLWSTGANGPHLEVNTGGTYTLTATNASGCSYSQTETVVMKPSPVAAISGNLMLCPNSTTTLTASGGDSYVWSTGATTASITVSSVGTYSVTVTSDGCSSTASAVVTDAASSITASGPTTFCHGGSVTLTAASADAYLWSTGQTTQSIVVAASGNYTVQSTHGGCTVTSAPVAVSVGPEMVTINSTDPYICPGESITYTSSIIGGGSNLTYEWFYTITGEVIAGATEPTLVFTPPQPGYGYLALRVTDANGCTVTSNGGMWYLSDPPKPVITPLGPSTTFCESGNVTLESSEAPGYLWSTGETTRWITVSTSGSYTVTTSNGSGCLTASDPVVVTVLPRPPAPTITADGPLSFCAGGSVRLTGPDGYAQYSWSTGETTQSIVVSTTSNVALTVINAEGCNATSDVQVTVNDLPATPVVTASGSTFFCEGGSVTLTAPASASYLWSNGATTQSIVVTATGSYSVTITNANGCTSATSAATAVTVDPVPATPSITAGGPTRFCEGGSVTLSAPANYFYLWSNGATTQSIVVTASGSYSVTVTNQASCSATSAATVVTVDAAPATPTITASGPTSFCEGGSVTLSAPAGFSYLWSTGATTQSIVANTSGSYSVTVTNANGCSATSAATAVTVNALPATPVVTASGPTSFCEGGSVTLTAPASASYLWSTGATTQSIVANTSGSYSVTVTNANGCSATSAATTVTVNSAPSTPVVTASGPTSFCEGGSVTLTAPASTSYLWSTGATTQSIVANTSGSYSVTVTNANGCNATSAATAVTVNALPATPVVTASGPTSFCEGGSVTLTAPSSTSYLWSTGATTQSIVVSASGSYSVTTTNASGCSATSAATAVTVNAAPSTPVVTASGPTTFCQGGSVTLTAPSSTSYLWSTGATTQSIVVNASGSYSVTTTNASGCSATSAATAVTLNAAPATPVVTASGPTTFCEGGSVTLTAPASTSYLWSNGATTQSIVANASGSYSVTVTNANGCSTASAATVVTVNPLPAVPVITPSGSTNLCPGQNVTLTAPAGFTYLWSNGATTQSIVVNSSGNYHVTVTNANGCSRQSAPVSVTTNAPTVITTHPASQSMPRTQTRTLFVNATGTPNLQYQWYNGSSGDTSSPIAGQTNSTMNIGPYPKKGTQRYWVRVWSSTCPSSSANSNTATITVTP